MLNMVNAADSRNQALSLSLSLIHAIDTSFVLPCSLMPSYLCATLAALFKIFFISYITRNIYASLQVNFLDYLSALLT